MSGIVFYKTKQLADTVKFYREKIGMEVWLDQGPCCILKSGNLLLGFCEGPEAETSGVITFFYDRREEVDAMYAKMKGLARHAPRLNEKFHIYHFYASDPEGRTLEFQHFEHPLLPYQTIDEVLRQRRSIRKYKADPVPDDLLDRVFELCRHSPTARNLQAYYYVVVSDRGILERIVEQRGPAGNPILAAPLAIAVCASGEVSRRKVQDACIAAYHLLLAAHALGLGTCWVTDMDNDLVKGLLDIPQDDYVACLTPLGWPAEHFSVPDRHKVSEFVRYL
ncbi:MAG: nitroreductase family protein [Candidatus Syntrophosphaera sp.]|nr:nitroreductase family protein [Candidatus Syntrophosphaera sp.]